MNDQGWEALLGRVRRDYNPPPATPAAEMWKEIEKALPDSALLQEGESGPLPSARGWERRGTLAAVLSIAAVLLLWLGFGLGRATVPGPGIPTVAASGEEDPDRSSLPRLTATGPASASAPESAYEFAAVRLLTSTGTLLGQVEDQAASGSLQADAGLWAKGLLTQTRLMLDSPSVAEEGLRGLLEDLELVLMQVVTVSEAQESGDGQISGFEMEQLTNGLREGDVLPRIQRMLPPVLASDS